MNTDSCAIQVDDILIPFDGIKTFLKNEQSKLDESDRENFITLLHADKETPEDFIIKIREAMRKYNPNCAYVKATLNGTPGKFFRRNLVNGRMKVG